MIIIIIIIIIKGHRKKKAENIFQEFVESRSKDLHYRNKQTYFSLAKVYWYLLLFSHLVVSNSLQPHEVQHSSFPCPSLSPGVHADLSIELVMPSSHPATSSSAIPFSSCPQYFPASGSFPTSQFFTSGGQSIRASASASLLPMNIQDWFPLGWTGLISLLSKRLLRVFSSSTV